MGFCWVIKNPRLVAGGFPLLYDLADCGKSARCRSRQLSSLLNCLFDCLFDCGHTSFEKVGVLINVAETGQRVELIATHLHEFFEGGSRN
jgi:hypothetical protein